MSTSGQYLYSIGIDLGTSNCALALVNLSDPKTASTILDVPQWETPTRTISSRLLPSCAYYPTESDIEQNSFGGSGKKPVVGIFGRNVASQLSDRVVQSAKSWLCHAGIDREAKILPWLSESVSESDKLSPVESSALFLNFLRQAWDQAFAHRGPRYRFDKQQIVVTVPASFDQDAQKLTLQAAALAGYPPQVRLLEEPQAAFYAWLERHPEPDALRNALQATAGDPVYRVFVCDIGGGTTDLSLFSIEFTNEGAPVIDRIAVSEHLLLGGDNIDLALAKMLEPQLVDPGSHVSPRTWQNLVNECRILKEQALSENAPEEFRISISEMGTHLFAGAKTATVRREEILDLVNTGFFPFCNKNDRASRGSTGLRELGLPYAKDTAVTRHCADFLSDYHHIDAVLFNGGALTPLYLQKRIQRQITMWQNGREPVILENSELDLAVARGAARFGMALALRHPMLISAGASRGFYLEVAPEEKKEKSYLICIMPLGTLIEAPQKIGKLDLHLRVNQPVSFRPYSTVRRRGDHAGQLVRRNEGDFMPLPPMETIIRSESGDIAHRAATVPVNIEAQLNALGLLQVWLVHSDGSASAQKKWSLEFNLRALSGPEQQRIERPSDTEAQPLPENLRNEAFRILSGNFSRNLFSDLEHTFLQGRKTWNRLWLRVLWEPLYKNITRRNRSVDYEASWLNAAGYFLRPGYGVVHDDYRVDQLWNLHELGLAYPKEKAIKEQYYVLWRRVGGGLSIAQQTMLYTEALPLIQSHIKQAQEALKMAGSFELLPLQTKKELIAIIITELPARKDRHCEPYLWALGRLLSRVPLYAGEESIVPPGLVEQCFAVCKEWDWTQENLRYLCTAFALAGRKTSNRSIDIPPVLRTAIVGKLVESKAKEHLISQVGQYIPVEREDLDLIFGESLPSGLEIRSF
jgi:molecular chaperone DnaK (HSP70)